jgi:hypothetical protein
MLLMSGSYSMRTGYAAGQPTKAELSSTASDGSLALLSYHQGMMTIMLVSFAAAIATYI